MREIKFRGKRINRNGEWAYGDLRRLSDRTLILPQGSFDAAIDRDAVDESTIGQFTGLLSKDGKKIYEGDIITCTNKIDLVYAVGQKMIGYIEYDEERCYYFCKNNFQHYSDWVESNDIEVVGNIHDNPELLKNND